MTPLEPVDLNQNETALTELRPQELEDIQSYQDSRRIPIQKVGIRGLELPIRVRLKEGDPQSTVATFTLMVDLRHSQRGTHMSRLVEILNEFRGEIGPQEIAELLKTTRHRLQSDVAWLEMNFPFFLKKQAPASGLESWMNYKMGYRASIRENKVDIEATLRAGISTLCPCSKAISQYGAHNQRGEVTLTYRFNGVVWAEDMLRFIETSGSSELYALLKRSDEKAVTEQAYENPSFVEDLVRSIALKLKAVTELTWFRIEAENFESIHNHNAYASVTSDSI